MKFFTQILKNNDCYKAGKTITPRGVMIHSTGANNPHLSRYVPGNDEIGRNTGGNHWDMSGTTACVHAFVGKLADGNVGVVQTLPWNRRGWHAGKGSRGTANDTHISFEICEDGLQDASYFSAVYQAAVELTADLCKQYGLDPEVDGVVICHSEGHAREIASNHADVMHWFPIHGKGMNTFRADVARVMEGEKEMTEDQIRTIVREELQAIEMEKSKLGPDDYAVNLLADAVEMGITDGSRPQSKATRQEVAIMVRAGICNRK